jgi:tetratricopeptide (TPR) repeat protein
MDHALEQGRNQPGGNVLELAFRSGLAAYGGQVKLARELGQKSRDAAQQLGLKELAANNFLNQAVIEAFIHNKDRALEDVGQAQKLSQSPNVLMQSALVLAVTGEGPRALHTVEAIAQKRPYDAFVQFVAVPVVKAQIAIDQKDAARAIDLLDSSMAYARVNTTVLYIRGNSFLRAGRGSDAVQAFQRLIDLRNFAGVDPLIPLAHLGLAQAYAQAGNNAQSRLAFQDFFGAWKNADPDLPILKEARTEYARVQ